MQMGKGIEAISNTILARIVAQARALQGEKVTPPGAITYGDNTQWVWA